MKAYRSRVRSLAELAVRALARESGIAIFFLVMLAGNDATAQEVPFRRVHELLPEGYVYYPVASDWDGDGDADLVQNGLSYLLENVDHGRFQLRALPGSTYHYPLAAADLDLDGLSDLVALDPMYPDGPSVLDIWINPGGAAFVAPSSVLSSPVPNTGHAGAAIGDLDSDGDDDIYAFEEFMPRGIGGPDVIFWNDGTGAFEIGSSSIQQGIQTRRVELLDFDGDGDLDVLRADDRDHALWRNDGAGSFVAAAQPVPPGTITYSLRAADLNADSLPDFLTGNPPRLFENQGEGRFADAGPVLPLLPPNSPFLFPLADLDGDEVPDALAYVDPYQRGFPVKLNNAILFFRNDGTGRFEADIGALPLPPQAGISTMLDVDGDRDLDLVGSLPEFSWGLYRCYYGIGRSDLWLNDGKGFFTEARDPWETGTQGYTVAAGDLDGDSFPDVLAFFGPTVYLYRNLRNGGFREEMQLTTQEYYPASASLADVDGDGDLDAFAWGPLLLLNDGHGGFTDATSRLPDPTFFGPYSDLGDLDRDGDPDLLLVTEVSHTKWQGHLWSNDGLGNFSGSTTNVPTTASYVGNFMLGDVDGDLDLDAVILPGRLWLNDGSAGFVNVSGNSVSPFPGYVGTLADLDVDGDVDVLSSYEDCFDICATDHNVSLNDGQGVFSLAPALWPNASCQAGWVSAADFDEDGDPDVIDGNKGFWLNDGTGQLEDESYELPHRGASSERVAIADFDLDGDLDVWYPGFPLPVMNVTRHVTWRSYPRVGKALTMEIFGPAGTPFQLFASDGFTEPKATDYGSLRLSTRGARLVASGTLDSLGQAAATLGIPSDRALPGETVYWQALVGNPPRFTNLELTTFRDL